MPVDDHVQKHHEQPIRRQTGPGGASPGERYDEPEIDDDVENGYRNLC